MTKSTIKFFCKNCGYSSSKWLGKCPSCEEWNSFTEEIVTKSPSSKTIWSKNKNKKIEPIKVQDITSKGEQRILLPDNELNRVFGGGLVTGSISLIGGEPGIGKSTLLLQMALNIKKHVLYISGEESESQLKMRAERIGIQNENCYVLSETSLHNLLNYLQNNTPELLVIDSVQTLSSDDIDSPPGSISQIKECTAELLRYARNPSSSIINRTYQQRR